MNVEEKAEDYIELEEDMDFQKVDNSENESAAETEKPKTRNIWSILTTKTGEGTIEKYQDHPLNFNKSGGIAQILRGLTGFMGALDLAVIDIGMGIFRVMQDRKNNV
jgi:hypothetical protein